MTALGGIYVPLITPFTADGRVATDALADLATSALAEGAAGIVALGTTAEVSTLEPAERIEVLDTCAEVCRAHSAPLIIGAGSNNTRATVAALAELTRWPEAVAALVTVPAFTRPSAAGVHAHFAHLAETSPLPLVIYHIPYRTGQSLDATALRELGALPGIAGVKYAVGGIDAQTIELFADLPPDFAVLAGDDLFVLPLLALGAAGGILASAHLATSRFVALHTAWQQGNLATARDLGTELAQLALALFREPNPTVLKGVLHAQGRIPTPDVRLPLLAATPESVAAASKLLAEIGA